MWNVCFVRVALNLLNFLCVKISKIAPREKESNLCWCGMCKFHAMKNPSISVTNPKGIFLVFCSPNSRSIFRSAHRGRHAYLAASPYPRICVCGGKLQHRQRRVYRRARSHWFKCENPEPRLYFWRRDPGRWSLCGTARLLYQRCFTTSDYARR